MQIDPIHVGWAVGLGVVSAISLPMGSAIGLLLRPSARAVGTLAAFGAGALLAALAVELVAPTLAELEMHGEGHESGTGVVLSLIGGAIAGGVVFVLLDRALAERGAFLRKTGSAILYFRRAQRLHRREFLADLSRSKLLSQLPADAIGPLADAAQRVELSDGEMLFAEGDAGDRLYVLRSGAVELLQAGRRVGLLGPGDVVGELALLTGAARVVGARASGVSSALAVDASALAAARAGCPALDAMLRELAGERLRHFQETREQTRVERDRWTADALTALEGGDAVPTHGQLAAAREEHGGAGLAVWLGMVIDGIPESLVIGASFAGIVAMQAMTGGDAPITELIPYTLIAGLFLANLPEAMSSSVAMRAQGFAPALVMGLWLSLVVVTAVGAGIGFAISDNLSPRMVAAIEGIAAGAMLTAIASTMIPESVHLSDGHTVGLSTLAGFLSAVAFKLLESV